MKIVCLAAAMLALGCLPAETEPAPSNDPVELRGVVAGYVGTGILLQNHSTEDLIDVEIVINEDADGGFRFEVAEIKSNTTQTYLTQAFRNAAGVRFDPDAIKVRTFAVYADTPRGRGSWRGEY